MCATTLHWSWIPYILPAVYLAWLLWFVVFRYVYGEIRRNLNIILSVSALRIDCPTSTRLFPGTSRGGELCQNVRRGVGGTVGL